MKRRAFYYLEHLEPNNETKCLENMKFPITGSVLVKAECSPWKLWVLQIKPKLFSAHTAMANTCARAAGPRPTLTPANRFGPWFLLSPHVGPESSSFQVSGGQTFIGGSRHWGQSAADILSQSNFRSMKWELLWIECLSPPKFICWSPLNVTVSGDRTFTKENMVTRAHRLEALCQRDSWP